MPPSLRLTEGRCLVLLLALFILSSAFILSFHHSLDNPTVPDEKAYYGWAKLFNRGYIAVPLEDWYGMNLQSPFSRIDLLVNRTGIHFLQIQSEVLSLDSNGSENDIRVLVIWELGSPVAGARVSMRLGPRMTPLIATTNSSGQAQFLNVPAGLGLLDASFSVPQPPPIPPFEMHASDLIAIGMQGEPYRTTLTVHSFSLTQREITVRSHDSFDTPMENVNISLMTRTPSGFVAIDRDLTDIDGKATFTFDAEGGYVLVGNKESLGQNIVGPSVVLIDGKYVVVNRWAPGYQILLSGFLLLGITEITTLLLMSVASSAAYILTRRLFGWRAASLATVLLMSCALALIMVFEVGMADYASMTFSLLGFCLFFEALVGKRGKLLSSILFLSSGLALGAAVWMRYSTVTLALVPLIYILALAFREGRDEGGRLLPTKASIKKGFGRVLPLIAGLAILGVPLAMYNSTYFGSPFASGYNFGSISIQSEGENVTGVVTPGSFYENFNPAASLSTIQLRFYYLLILVPFAYLIPLAMWLRRRSLPAWFFLGAFLANFLLYIFVPWVASWTKDVTRSIEDMRYFLPSVPSAAILVSVFLKNLWERWGWRRILAIALIILFVILGFSMATMGIDLQLQRLSVQRPPPPLR